MRGRMIAVAAGAGALLWIAPSAPGSAAGGAGAYLVNDYGTPATARNIIPPGQAGDVTVAQAAQERLQPGYLPPHLADQTPLYDGPTLVNAGQVSAAQMLGFTKENTFGVADSDIASTETPRPGVTIIRDRAFGVPHIFGATRADAKFGAGYATAEDRLFVIDVIRHDGRGNLASLLGSSGYGSDCGEHYATGYDSADEQAQLDRLPAQGRADIQSFTDGVNAFIQDPANAPRLPVEYAAFPLPGTPANPLWSPGDTLEAGALIGGQLGKGGGSEEQNTLALAALGQRFGTLTAARRVMDDFHAADDPESPTTIDQAFPYESRAGINPASVAMIDKPATDPGGCAMQGVGGSGIVYPAPNRPALPGGRVQEAARAGYARAEGIRNFLRFPKHASNALLVGAANSRSGHPLAVFGPQVAYWVPEIFMEMDIHAPDFDARGVQFPGTGVVVELGRGQDFAWSATSAGSDNIDQRVERLCNPGAADPLQGVDPNSTSYYYKGRCLPMVEKTLTYTVPPSPGTLPGTAPTPSSIPFVGQETFRVERAVHDDGVAVIQGRTTAKVNGVSVPVAVSTQRTNFLRELDQLKAFDEWNTPSIVHDAASFIAAASAVDTTFNWLYVDDRDIAYYSSGRLPIRAPGADPDLLTWATGEWDWQGILPASQHPHAISPARGWMTSWNNRPAPHFGSSDGNYDYGSLYRNQLLDREITRRLAAGKMDLVGLFNAMQVASITDFRAQRMIDEFMAVIGPVASLPPAEQAALAAISTWHAAGDLRQDQAQSGTYAHADGISYFDSWYPLLTHAIYDPWLGKDLGGLPKTFDNPPDDGHRYGGFSGYGVGSAFDGGFYDAIDKDLRQVLGRPVLAPHSHMYCGGAAPSPPAAAPVEGNLAACRAELLAALDHAINDPALPSGSGHWTDLAAMTADDRIDYRALGLQALPTSPWSNKPTFQQSMEFTSHRSRGTDVVTAPLPMPPLPNTARAAAGSATGVALLLLVALLARAIRARQRGLAG